MTKRLRPLAVPLVAAAALALACDGERARVAALAHELAGALDATAGVPAEAAGSAPAAAAGVREGVELGASDPAAAPPTGGYWRYVEANGSLRFVASLAEVPAAARASAQHVAGAGATPPAAAPRTAARPPPRPRPALAAAPEPGAPRAEAAVVVYTTSWCGWCRKTLAWLDARGVAYDNRDIERDEAWAAELRRKTGGTSIPVVDVGGRIVRGFDPDRLAELL